MSSIVQYSTTEQDFGYTMRSIRRPFNKKFPTIVGVLIGILQMLLNGAIVGLEGGSVAYNPRIDIIYAGFWCSVSFSLTWISMFAFLCFYKTLRWGLVVAGINLASIAFAVILIVFDSLFIQYPCQCYLATVCNLTSSTNDCSGSDGKLRIVIAQIACAAAMLALNIGYIILFFIIVRLSRTFNNRPMNPSYRPLFHPLPSPYSPSPTVLTNVPIQTRQSFQHPALFDNRYRQSTYSDHTTPWRPSTPYFNRLEKF